MSDCDEIIDATLAIIREMSSDINSYNHDFLEISDDKETFQLLGQGNTNHIFQLETKKLKKILKKLKPKSMIDLTVVHTLSSNNPIRANLLKSYIERKMGREQVEKIHPLVDNILEDTYGLLIFSEQMNEIIQRISGFTQLKSNKCRRAIGKKHAEKLKKYRLSFNNGASKKGIPGRESRKIFSFLEEKCNFADKHFYECWAELSYTSAFLKAHYPKEFAKAINSIY